VKEEKICEAVKEYKLANNRQEKNIEKQRISRERVIPCKFPFFNSGEGWVSKPA